MNFRQFLVENDGAFLNTAFTGFDNQTFGTGHSLNLPTPTLDIPTRIIRSKIRQIRYTENPIVVILADNTELRLNYEQWQYLKSIGRELKEGLTAQIEMFLDGTIKSVDLS